MGRRKNVWTRQARALALGLIRLEVPDRHVANIVNHYCDGADIDTSAVRCFRHQRVGQRRRPRGNAFVRASEDA